MIREVIFHGALASPGQTSVKVNCRSAAQAIELLSPQIKTLKPDAVNGRKRIMLSNIDTEADLYADHPHETLHVMPALAMAKDDRMTNIIIGATLIVIGITIGNMELGKLGMQIAVATTAAGIGLVVGGLIAYLSPQPDSESSSDQRSKYLGPVQNTTRVGTTIPLLYGRRRVGGHFLSMQIDAKEVV